MCKKKKNLEVEEEEGEEEEEWSTNLIEEHRKKLTGLDTRQENKAKAPITAILLRSKLITLHGIIDIKTKSDPHMKKLMSPLKPRSQSFLQKRKF